MPYQNPPEICPVCKEKADFKFVQDYKSKEGKWSLYECSKCKVQFWQPMKTPGANWYENKYECESAYLTRENGKPSISRLHKKFIENIKNYPQSIKVLDLGCGTGDVIAELQKRGYEAWGVDLNRNAINFIKKFFKLKNVYAMSFDEFFKLPNLPKFDVITFFEVIEHLENPLEFIQNVSKLLKENGKILLSTPSRERILPNISESDFPPNHLTRWNEEAISNLFKNIGFKIENIDYVGQFEFIFSSLADKLRFGLVLKTMKISKKNSDKENVSIKNTSLTKLLTKIVHLGARFKDYFLFSIPSLVLFLISKITGGKKRKNGTMLVCLKKIT